MRGACGSLVAAASTLSSERSPVADCAREFFASLGPWGGRRP